MQTLEWLGYGRVFHCASDYVSAFITQSTSHTTDCQVVGLSSAAGKHDLRRLCINQSRYLFTSLFHCLVGIATVDVIGRGIAVVLAQLGLDGICYLRINRRGSVVIHIYRCIHCISLYCRRVAFFTDSLRL